VVGLSLHYVTEAGLHGEALIDDLGRDGVLAHLSECLPSGTSLTMRLALGRPGPIVNVSGAIVRTRRSPLRGKWLTAISFRELDDADRARIVRVLTHHPAEP